MKRFIIKTIYLSLPILVSAIVMEILLRNIPNDYSFKKKYLDKHSDEIETLILGSSHSFYGLNPEFFSSKAFNASHISQSIDYDLEILNKYQSNLNSLKTVVLPISYFTLYKKLEAGAESWRIKNYIIYYEIPSSKSLIDNSEVFGNQFSVNFKRLDSYHIKGQSNVTCTELGWGTEYQSEKSQDLAQSGKEAALRHVRDDINNDKYKTIFDDNVAILISIVEWCKVRNIKLILLTTPTFETYRQHLNIEQINSTISTTQKIASKFDNCIYLNLLDDTNFTAKDFYDADHLSEIGAKKLSILISDKLNDLH